MVNQFDISIVHSGCSSGVCVLFSFFLFISVHSYSISQRKRDESELYLVKLLASVSVSVLVSRYVCVGSVCGNSHRRM